MFPHLTYMQKPLVPSVISVLYVWDTECYTAITHEPPSNPYFETAEYVDSHTHTLPFGLIATPIALLYFIDGSSVAYLIESGRRFDGNVKAAPDTPSYGLLVVMLPDH